MKTNKFNSIGMEWVRYGDTGTSAWFDGEYYYNNTGMVLRDPEEYNHFSEGYTPFGDE